MDKRWILIIIIIILAAGCGYFIVSSSNTVGNAIVDLNKSTVTIPHHFSVGSTDSNSVNLYEKSSSEKIYIKDLGKRDDALKIFNKKLNSLSKDPEIKILKNESNLTEEYDYYSVYFQDLNDLNASTQSIGYLHKSNHTYLLKFSGFDNITDMNDNIDIIKNTLKLDHKKSQE